MVRLCCPKSIAKQYQDGTLSFETAKESLNIYTTTLHAVNSAVIKLGKLTKAETVYRGIGGKALPTEFWTPNSFGVRGGVEPAFMSTTLNREVAMTYASGSDVGIVLAIRQGMVNRGADISARGRVRRCARSRHGLLLSPMRLHPPMRCACLVAAGCSSVRSRALRC